MTLILKTSNASLLELAPMSWIYPPYNVENVKGKYLYKFLSKSNLEKFLKSGEIWFSRSDVFGDKMECVKIGDLKKEKLDYQSIEKRKQKHLISCWHVANNESLSFWDTYSQFEKDRKVFAVRFNRQQLIEKIETFVSKNALPKNIKRMIHGRVRYKSLINTRKEKLDPKKVKFPSLRKEYIFLYEREYRFVIELNSPTNKLGYGYKIGNPRKLQFKILINPLVEEKKYESLKDFLLLGPFSSKFTPSNLIAWLKPDL